MFRFLLKSLILFFLYSNTSLGDIVKSIEVDGNKRVSPITIINFSNLEINQDINDNILNDTIKNLYETNFFENVELSFLNGVVKILVTEYPIVQTLSIEGIKSKSIAENIRNNLLIKEKNPFNKILVEKDVQLINNLFKKSGYYFVKVDVKILENDNSSIDIIYTIDRGVKASISKIDFIGDKKFKNKKLRSIIVSDEDRFWKFLTDKVFLNIERINLDKRLLENFYKNKGYYNVNITDVYSKLIDKEKFNLIYNIDAGIKYYFNNFEIILPDEYDQTAFNSLINFTTKLKGKYFSLNTFDTILEEIELISLNKSYEFIDISIEEEIIDNNKVNFKFSVTETENIYVNRVNILGNNITSENFIRNNLIVDEGDPLNNVLQNKSINNIKSKGIFKNVEYEIVDTDDDFKKDINIFVEEKPTGEISAGAGYGTDGSTFSFGIKEKNFKGEGIDLSTTLSLSEDSIRGSFFYTNPNFAYSEKALTTSLSSTKTDKLSDFGYETTLNEVSLGTSYEQFNNIYFSPNIIISDEVLKTTNTASNAYKKQAGSYFDTYFNYNILLDNRNQKFQPTDGFISSFSQELPLISDNSTLINTFSLTGYNELSDNMVLSSGLLIKNASAINNNDDVRVSRRLYVPSSRLRGFESGKVGPKEGEDYIGGNYVVAFNNSSTIPYFLDNSENIDLKLFLDVANIWGVDYDSSIDESNKIRSSTGIALEILTPVGPLSFSYAEAISKASTDKTETFRFQLGTTF